MQKTTVAKSGNYIVRPHLISIGLERNIQLSVGFFGLTVCDGTQEQCVRIACACVLGADLSEARLLAASSVLT